MDIQDRQPLATPVEHAPRPFSELPSLWMQLPHMDEKFFAAEVEHTSNLNTFLSVLVYTAIATGCAILTALARLFLGGGPSATALGIAVVIAGCITLIGGPIAFYVNTGIYFASALLFGGKGTFGRQAYLHTLYFIPLAVFSSLGTFLQLIPRAGIYLSWLVVLVVLAFDVFFQVRAFKVVHGFSTGRAAASVLTPLVLIFGLICVGLGLIGLLAFMSPAIGNVFSGINQSLLTPAP